MLILFLIRNKIIKLIGIITGGVYFFIKIFLIDNNNLDSDIIRINLIKMNFIL